MRIRARTTRSVTQQDSDAMSPAEWLAGVQRCGEGSEGIDFGRDTRWEVIFFIWVGQQQFTEVVQEEQRHD